MGTQTNSTLHPMLWLAAASVTAVSLAGVARLAGFMPGSAEAPSPVAAAAPAAAPASASVAAPVARPVAPARAAHPHRPATETARPAPRMADNPPPVAAAVPEAQPHASGASRRVADAPPAVCRECGVIDSVEAVQQKGEGSGLGAVGGAILGGVLGHQIGEGSGKQIARIGGAVLGGLAGNEAEKRYRAVSHYRIGVRMDDGSYRVVEQQEAPAWRRGDAVRLQNGGIVAGGAAPAGSAAF